ncbi:zinc-finger homeodomain protein 6-like [Bidens hawaiensis]|uniref:zinc-finger homeodomain protein 6-like n=1 Tax=Bidens hawaiensis TaxID=980011 RepID=UPI00404AA8F7
MSNINQNNPSQFNRGSSSSSFFSYAPLNSSNETLDQSHPRVQQRESYHHHHGLQEQIEAQRVQREQSEQRERRESSTNPNPDPDPDPMPPPPPPRLSSSPSPSNSVEAAVMVRYRECQKNHAASMGAYVVDGCGEFMANGEEGTPESLKCAACDCHRSFHRREVEGEAQSTTAWIPGLQNPVSIPPRGGAVAAIAAAPSMQQHYQQQHHHRYTHHTPPIMVAFGGNNNNSVAPTESSSEDLDMYRTHPGQHPVKKRFRTKFTDEQKAKMHDFAEKIGWKIQKQDEQEILRFCEEVGLKRKVFKVWMHNCKQASKKKQE